MKVLMLIGLLLIAAGIGFYVWQRGEAPKLPPPPMEGPKVTVPTEPAPPRFPMGEAEPKALPALKESDPTILQALSALIGPDAVARYLVPEELVRHIVVTIDNLPRHEFAVQLSPIRGPGGLPRTSGKDDNLTLAIDNSLRYAPYVRLVESVPTDKLVAAYAHYYPLFQQAYVELGFPNGYFNDRLIEVIDHLIATPETQGPIKLAVPHVLYEYADPDLEALSSGQKMLIRIGPDNARKVKAKLTQIRAEILAQVKKA